MKNSMNQSQSRIRFTAKPALVAYVTCGDPNISITKDIVLAACRSGADVIELGVPFSDPVADGPVIQRASERALRNGFGLPDVLDVLADARRETDVPVILFSYFNPMLRFGVERLASAARRCGFDGILATDLIPEESAEFNAALARHRLDQIFLFAPTTSAGRLRVIAGRA